MAAKWLQKLRDNSFGSLKTRTDYLKLLLLALQRRTLTGPFAVNPETCPLLDFPDCQSLQDVAKELLDIETEELGECSKYPPYMVEYSSNMLEYVSYQEIPLFGAHVYYAISKEPIGLWYHANKGAVPREQSLASRPTLAIPDAEIGERRVRPIKPRSARSLAASAVICKNAEKSIEFEASDVNMLCSRDIRKPIIWGSNLTRVSDSPLPLKITRMHYPENLCCPGLSKLMEETCSDSSQSSCRQRRPPDPCSTEVLYARPGSAPCPKHHSCPRQSKPSRCSEKRPSTQGGCCSSKGHKSCKEGSENKSSFFNLFSRNSTCGSKLDDGCGSKSFIRSGLKSYQLPGLPGLTHPPRLTFENPLSNVRKSVSVESYSTPTSVQEPPQDTCDRRKDRLQRERSESGEDKISSTLRYWK
ncbi:uncharacterized protein LOC108737680 isoform X2 [Agrilus planipennis]|nr:uncharacterized protein LOC108737680 isoform X2 [Agrilus planipennis]XP_018326207.1 uncharacterized protein LOC108737680 isoform X2 [Agrilus planipennis]